MPPAPLISAAASLAGELRQGAGEDEGPALQGPPAGAPFGGVLLEPQPLRPQLLDQLPGPLVGERLGDLHRHDRADPLDLLDPLGVGALEGVDRAEVVGERLGGDVADARAARVRRGRV